MKNLIMMILLAIAACGCTKKNTVSPYQSKGVLTGYDYAACAFCGGIKITIQNDTAHTAPAFYRIDSTLSQLNIAGVSSNASFPINVSLNWKLRPGYNPGNVIVVSNIALAK